MAGSGSSAISQARIEVLDETGARETKSRGVLNERALGIGRLIFGWHLPFHVAQIRDARALDGKLIKPHVRIHFLNRGDDLPGDRGARCELSACVALTGHAEASQQRIDFGE
jgi:hypothetical protein